VLDDLASELLERETLDRRELERLFAGVVKRPRITTFDDWGQRTPSDRPPVKTPRELALERGEPWPPPSLQKSPVPIGASVVRDHGGQGGAGYGQPHPYPNQPQGAPAGYPYPYGPPHNGSAPPPNWTGGVLPGPLAPMPGTWNGGGGSPNGSGAPNGAGPHNCEVPGSANGWGGNGNGHPLPNGHPGAGAGQSGEQRAGEPANDPTDPWAPPGDRRR